MLSYRHGYHAGNFADLLKHTVLLKMAEYLQEKPRAVLFIDTHAGAGSYDLTHDYALKTNEFREGIGKLWAQRRKAPKLFQPLLQHVADCQSSSELTDYPGSPRLIAELRRVQDHAVFFELHTTEVKELKSALEDQNKTAVHYGDGLEGMIRMMPPRGGYHGARAIILVDPSYEIKTEYQTVPDAVDQAWQNCPQAMFAIWYPVIDRARTEAMMDKYRVSGIRNILRVEQCMVPDAERRGMTGAGVLLVNPPWTIKRDLEDDLSWLSDTLGATGPITIDMLVEE